MRQLSPRDVDGAVALDREAYPSPGLWTQEQYLEEIERPRGFAVGVLDEASDRMLAMLFMAVVLDEAMITNLAVSHQARGRGLATRLLDTAVADGRRAGVRLFVLEVRKANRVARALYESRGFVQAGTRRGYYHNPRDDASVLLLRFDEEGEEGSEDSGHVADLRGQAGGDVTEAIGTTADDDDRAAALEAVEVDFPSAPIQRGVEIALGPAR
jgi:ribosomal-protein-alanine N-acetyltransferase